MTESISFTVIGKKKMNCSACEANIRFALQRLPGIHEVTPDARTQRVAVAFEPAQVTPEQVQATIKEIGFDVERSSP